MNISTMSCSNMRLIPNETEIVDTIYVSQIPYSLQLKLSIYSSITIGYTELNGNKILVVYNGNKGNAFTGKKIREIIKTLNGFSKANNITKW